MSSSHDVAIVGGGPAGSTCARALIAGGARVVVIDRAVFPRVKLCAGWLSAPIWDVLEIAPSAYPRASWPWHRCHVRFRDVDAHVAGRGWFIRRYELDDFLLRRSGAELRLGANVKRIVRDDDGDAWVIELPDGPPVRARHLVGAAGTNCPVARMLEPPRPRRALGVQELETRGDATEIARTRLGRDGEPELLLFDDLGGYGWNVPKSEWINVGCGTLDAAAVRGAWTRTRAYLTGRHHVPHDVDLANVAGHAYYLFASRHLERAYHDGVLLVGDALGLAHPVTGEGILPATISGRIAAAAILSGEPATYPARLVSDAVIRDYRRLEQLGAMTRGVRGRSGATGSWMGRYAIARGFGWMFSGRQLPLPRLIDAALGITRQGA